MATAYVIGLLDGINVKTEKLFKTARHLQITVLERLRVRVSIKLLDTKRLGVGRVGRAKVGRDEACHRAQSLVEQRFPSEPESSG